MSNELTERTLAEHIYSLAAKEYSSRELTLAYIDRINDRQSIINAYITTDLENALKSADEADARRASGRPLSTFDGIPYAAKDNLSTRGLRTTCGSKMLENYVPPFDAAAVARLKLCGAVLLGKTNLDEFAMGVSTETSYFGTTMNPLDPTRVSGGSSGGSAAAVADGEAAFALGSDTGGSVRQPAAFCGVIGMRPTYGAMSRYGLIGLAPSLDQVGIITKNIVDTALISNLLFYPDSRDETSAKYSRPDFSCELFNGVKGLRIGILDELSKHGVSDRVIGALHNACRVLEASGACSVHVELPHAYSAYAAYYTISCAEASSCLARFDGVRYGHRAEGCDSIDELYTRSRTEGFGYEVKRRIMFGSMVLSPMYKSDFYTNAVYTRKLITAELAKAFEDIDVLLLPTAPTIAYMAGEAKGLGFAAGTHDIFCALASLAGLPALSIPCPAVGGMSAGIQLVGKAFSESLLYRVGALLEHELSGGDKK